MWPLATEMQLIENSLSSHIFQLPDELLLAIVAQLEVRRGHQVLQKLEKERQATNAVTVQALHTLTLTCRKFNAIATPVLYQCIIQDQHRVWITKRLLHTLSTRPEYFQYIHYVECMRYTGRRRDILKWYSDADLSAYEQYLAKSDWTTPQVDLQPSRDGAQEPNDDFISKRFWAAERYARKWLPLHFALGTVMAFAPNLDEVLLTSTSFYMLILALKRYSPSKGLRSAWLCNASSPLLPIYTFRASPTSQSNPIAEFLGLDYEVFKGKNPPPKLVELSLNVYDLDLNSFRPRLNCCGALEHFSCLWRSVDLISTTLPPPTNEVNLPELRDALSKFTGSLKSLTIDTMDSSWAVDMGVDIPAFGSLREFNSLTYLEVTGLVLWGDNDSLDYPKLSTILPESLEVLIIKTEWDEDVEDALHSLCEDCSTMLPRLKKVDCTWRPAPRFMAEYLTEAFRKLAVELVLIITDEESSSEG